MKSGNFFNKFLTLHGGEESLRANSLGLIAADHDSRLHAEVIEAGQNLLHVLIHDEEPTSEDDLTIRLLGIRLFNSCASSLKLLLSGYTQNATIQMRDILETTFLLDYFLTDRGLIADWRGSDKKKRLQKFSPVKVRCALDDRDGFTERKREAAYNLLCELAAHPTNLGFQMLLVDSENAHCGPFVEERSLKAALAGRFSLDEAEQAELRSYPTIFRIRVLQKANAQCSPRRRASSARASQLTS